MQPDYHAFQRFKWVNTLSGRVPAISMHPRITIIRSDHRSFIVNVMCMHSSLVSIQGQPRFGDGEIIGSNRTYTQNKLGITISDLFLCSYRGLL